MAGKIQFKCPKCSADFGVDEKFAGRPCRCKHCGNQFQVPGTKVSAAPAPSPKPAQPQAVRPPQPRQPALAGVGAAESIAFRAAQRAQVDPSVPKPTSWLDAVSSQIALKPVTANRLQAVGGRAQAYMDDDDGHVGPYELASYPSLPLNKVPRKGIVKGAKQVYSNRLRLLQKWLRWLNETALELSVPFFILMPVGYILQKHWLAMFGLIMVILLNLGRFIVGWANLLLIPFRESPMTGLTFLVPPIGYAYLKRNWHKCRKPFQRITSPTLFMLGMFLLYVFVPWFNDPEGDKHVKMIRDKQGKLVPAPDDQQPPAPSIGERLKEGAQELRKEIRHEVDEAKDQLPGAARKLEKAAGDAVEKAQDAAQGLKEKISTESPPASTPPPGN